VTNDNPAAGAGGIPPAAQGAAWMLLGALSYTVTGALVRILAGEYPMFEIVFLRCVIAVFMMAPLIMRLGVGKLKTRQPVMHLVRTSIGYGGILCWFYGVSNIPLTDYYALQFTMPLFTIAGAVLLLGEHSSFKTWVAVGFGFFGALVILRPGLIDFSLGALAALTAALSFACINIMIRIMARKDDPAVIVVYANFLMIPMALIPALFDWVTPAWEDIPAIVGIGIFGTLAQFSLTRAVALADARVVQPFDFARVPFAALIGWFVFGEISDVWTWVGAVMIFAAAYYVLTTESRRKKN
jgi:S-adenosylmethionine uptake transporter